METLMITDFLFWSFIINYGILLLWFLVFVSMHDFIYGLHTRWFNLSLEQFDRIHYIGMAIYKLLIFVFNLVPWIVLRFVL